jgi:hypothetical protein
MHELERWVDFIFQGSSFMKKLVWVNICKIKRQQAQITHYMQFWSIVAIIMVDTMLYLLILLAMEK